MAASDWLSSWLESLSLSEYFNLFTEHGYTDSDHFVSVDKNELQRIGLVKVGHQNRLLRAVDKIRTDAQVSSPLLSPHQPSQTDSTPNGLLNSDPSNHTPISTHQSPPLSPTTTTSSSSSSQPTSSLISPPPVPLRRSLRQSSSTTSTQPPPTLAPPHSTSHSASQLPGTLDLPPPIKPRQQSLRGRSQSPDESPSTSDKSSSLPSAAKNQQKSQSTSGCSSHDLYPSEASETVAPNFAESNHLRRVKPVPTPRSPLKVKSVPNQLTPIPTQRPVPLPRKISKKAASADPIPLVDGENQRPPVAQRDRVPALFPEEGGHKTLPLVEGVSGGQEEFSPGVLPHPQENFTAVESDELEPPAIPVKQSPKPRRKEIAPEQDVLFELENVPIPTSSQDPGEGDLPTAGESQPNYTTEHPPSPTKQVSFPTPPRRASSSSLNEDTTPEAEQAVLDSPEVEVPPPPPQRTDSVRNQWIASSSLLNEDTTPEGEQATAEEAPPPPPQRTDSVRNQPEHPLSPLLPPSNSTFTEDTPSSQPPSLPHRSTPPTPENMLPSLPPKDDPLPPSLSPPPTSPPPSPPHSQTPPSPSISISPPPQSFTPPPLPPKSIESPPPPPPIEERYYTEDSFSESDEENEQNFMSITSGSLHKQQSLDVHTLNTESSIDLEEFPCSPETPLSSEENTPKHVIVQQSVHEQRGEASENIMALDPQPPLIVEPPSDGYANIVIDKEVGEVEVNKLGTIHGTPIRSRTLTPDQSDYMNQEILDEDIIPVTLAISPPAPDSVHGNDGMDTREQDMRDYMNLRVDEPPEICTNQGPPEIKELNTDPQDDIFADPMHLESTQSTRERRSMSPSNDKESALDFGRVSPNMLTPEQAAFKPSRSFASSGCSSGATTPGSLSQDSDHCFEQKEADATIPVSLPVESGLNRMAASVYYKPTGHSEQPSLPPSSGTFSCHNIQTHSPLKPHTPDEVDHSFELISLTDRPEDLENVPKTKEGYLHKKGGKRSQRPWQKRWIVFSGEELKYFSDRNYKESDALNHVRLRDMIDVKHVSDTQVNSDKYHRFDLVVIGRVFQFYSESREDCENWVTVLHAAIARFQPQENEKIKEGGSFHDPEKQGVLLKQGRGMRQGFKERYIALKGSKFAYYDNKEAFINARPIHILELALANVRPDPSGKHRFIITMNNQKTYTFQALNDKERAEWLETITTAILAGLVGGEKAPAPPTKKETTVQEVMTRIQENPANKVCADCAAPDPSWGVCNLGIMVCIECSGVHRSMGILVSKVRSLELDRSIWTDSLIKLMVEIGNERSNVFWEKHCKQERLQASVERDIRESFIRAKYQDRSWIPQPTGETEALSKQLLICVASNNLMRTIQLLVHGADVCYVDPDESNPELNTALAIAKHHRQDLQVELLEQNRALSCQKSETPQLISKKGHLYKTGTDRTGWRRRWCTVDQFRGMEYFRSETDPDIQGDIKIHEMLSISRCDEETTRDPKYSYCFEVNTQTRGYLFCADSKEDMEDWIVTLKKVIPKDGAEKLGYSKVGYLRKKDPHNVGGWKRRWFTLKGKRLVYFRREREELAEIDLKKVTQLKPPDPYGTPEAQCSFDISLPERVFHLRADTPSEADSWMQALRHTQVSGIPLSEQQITTGGIPIIVHKCLQFVDTFGLEVQGIYRMSGNMSKIRKLILGFNQDAKGFLIDSEVFTVHDVAGALKDFFKTLPDPLLTHNLYPMFIKIMKESDHEEQLYQLKAQIEKLPTVNRETLKRVIGHLRKVMENEFKNKMGKSNLVSLFAPTLMTVNADAISMANARYEFECMDRMIEYYKWLFDVKDEEEAKEKELQEAKRKIMDATEKSKVTNLGMTSTMKFLNTIYILNKSGDTYGTYITAGTLVGEVVEEVATNKALPQDHYALYLVIGDFDSYRVLSNSDRLLGALSSVGSDCYLCLKPNAFHATIRPFMQQQDGWEPIHVHVREKRKWKKCPCAVRAQHFIQFKDNKCTHEVARLPVAVLDIFAGMERCIRTDHKNPMPTRHFFWLKPKLEDQTKYICVDSEQDLLKLMAALVKAKYGSEGLQTPLLPTRPPPPELAARRSTFNVSPSLSPSIQRNDRHGQSFQS